MPPSVAPSESSMGYPELEIGKHRTAASPRGWALLLMAFQTLGIIYSDIGTSPLYVLNGIWPGGQPPPSREDVIGGISAIVWSLTLLPFLKYVFVSLRYGTVEGEGGTFALYQGLYPPKVYDTAPAHDSVAGGPQRKRRRRAPEQLRWVFLIWALFGTSLTIADGILTAAVSVTSAVGGIAVAKPEVTSDIVPISIAFLVGLFLAQPFGTARLSAFYSPGKGSSEAGWLSHTDKETIVAMVWFLLIAACGILNITKFPGIWRAWDPSRAILYFVRTKNYDSLAGVLLAITGCEALFANLGQFNMLSIQIGFGSFVYPALILAYLGQGARLIVDGPEVISNIFYRTIPGPINGPLFWILYVFAILATLIASQAMITGAFSLVQQLVNMKSLPPLRLVHTSEKLQGQIYVPVVNWLLAILTIILVVAFKNLTQLTNAYGFAVSTVMFTTTILIALQTYYVKHLPIVLAAAIFLFFGFLDGLFWGASLRKVPQGAWVPLMIGLIILTLMIFWNWAKGLEDEFDVTSRQSIDRFILVSDKTGELRQRDNYGAIVEDSDRISERDATYYCVVPTLNSQDALQKEGYEVRRELGTVPLLAVFHRMAHERGVPHAFTGFIRQWPALPRFAIFITVHVLPIGHVTLQDRYVVEKVESISNVYGVTYYLGFREQVDVEIDEIVKRVFALESRTNPSGAPEIIRQLSTVTNHYTHILPYYDIGSKEVTGSLALVRNYIRKFLIEDVYRRLCVMFPETVNWMAKPDEIIYVGVSARI